MQKKSLLWSGFTVVVAGFALFFLTSSSKKADVVMSVPTTDVTTDTTQTVAVNTGTQQDTTPVKTAKYIYADGVYTAVGTYNSPAGQESISVSLTLKNDLIIDSTVIDIDANKTESKESPQSKRFKSLFIGGYKNYVIGKNIVDVTLDKVSGSSLTPKGWNDAVVKIESQAKV